MALWTVIAVHLIDYGYSPVEGQPVTVIAEEPVLLSKLSNTEVPISLIIELVAIPVYLEGLLVEFGYQGHDLLLAVKVAEVLAQFDSPDECGLRVHLPYL